MMKRLDVNARNVGVKHIVKRKDECYELTTNFFVYDNDMAYQKYKNAHTPIVDMLTIILRCQNTMERMKELGRN
jgi:hypothetical protein